MTTIGLPRLETEDDGRYYIYRPGQPDERRLRSVTAPLGRWEKDGLKIWSALLAGQAAFDELPSLVAALALNECGRSWHPACQTHGWDVSCPECRCKRCEPCLLRWMRDRHLAESSRRSDEGSRVHEVVGHWAATGVWLTPDEAIAPYIKTFREFVREYGLKPQDWELLEARVVNLAYGYAGTLDAAIHIYRDRSKAAYDLLDRLTPEGGQRLDHALLLVDYKSREKPGRQLYLDQPLQLAGYRFAELLVLKDGTELPMFQVDGCAIIQIRPDATTMELVLAEEPELATFISLLQADEWALERGKAAIGARTFSYNESVKKLRERDSRQRRAAEKRAASGTEAKAAGETPKSSGTATETTEAATPGLTPEERGKRAAAATGRPAAAALTDLAASHGRPTVVKHASFMDVRQAQTAAMAVFDGDDPPF